MNPEKPVLASDWDDVNYPFIKFWLPMYNEFKGTDFKPEDIYEHNLEAVLGEDIEAILDLIDKFHEEVESVDHGLMPSVEQVVPILAEEYDIVIITARKKRFEYRVRQAVEHYLDGSISGIYLREDYEHNGHSKGSFVRALGAVALVDDHIKHVHSAIDNDVRGLLMDMPKNLGYDGPAEVVKDWYEIYEKLTGRPFSAHKGGG